MDFGLALGGGSLRGAAHIGVLQVLHRNQLLPDVLAGTSAGSIVAALYAAGVSPHQLENLTLAKTSAKPQLNVAGIPRLLVHSLLGRSLLDWLPMGLIKAQPLELILQRLLGNVTFDDLPLPVTIIATDINTGELVLFGPQRYLDIPLPPRTVFLKEVQVAQAVRASIAIPGIFTPQKIAGRTLVDGGLVDNVPADILRLMGARRVVAVDLGFAVNEAKPVSNMIELLIQTSDIMGQRVTDLVLSQNADLVLHPNTGPMTLWDFTKIPKAMQAGVKAAEAALPELNKLMLRN